MTLDDLAAASRGNLCDSMAFLLRYHMIDSAQVGRRTRRHNVYLGRSFASS